MARPANIRIVFGDKRFGAGVAGPEIAHDAALQQRGAFGRSQCMKTARASPSIRHEAREEQIGIPGHDTARKPFSKSRDALLKRNRF